MYKRKKGRRYSTGQASSLVNTLKNNACEILIKTKQSAIKIYYTSVIAQSTNHRSIKLDPITETKHKIIRFQ